MAYLTEQQLRDVGFKSLGRNVKISAKASIYDPQLIEIGDRSRIDDFCVISGRVAIGRNVHVTPQCLVAGGTMGITMEDFSVIAYQVKIFSQSDDYTGLTLTNSTVPVKFKAETRSAVRLCRHVIVGAGSTVFPGVTIAEGCSIGAMSLVNRSTEPWGIYQGTPARRVKERRKDLLELERQYLLELANDPV